MYNVEVVLEQNSFRILKLGKLLIISFSDFKFSFNTVIHELNNIIVEKPTSFAVTSSTGNKCGVVSIGYNIIRSFAEGTLSGNGITIIR